MIRSIISTTRSTRADISSEIEKVKSKSLLFFDHYNMAKTRTQIAQEQNQRFKEKHQESLHVRKVLIHKIVHNFEINYTLSELEVIARRAEEWRRVHHLTDEI